MKLKTKKNEKENQNQKNKPTFFCGRSDLLPKFETLFEKGLLNKNPRKKRPLSFRMTDQNQLRAETLAKIQRHEWRFTKKTQINYEEQDTITLSLVLRVMDVALKFKKKERPHCSFKKEISRVIGKAGPGNQFWKQSIHGLLAHRLYDQLFKIYKSVPPPAPVSQDTSRKEYLREGWGGNW